MPDPHLPRQLRPPGCVDQWRSADPAAEARDDEDNNPALHAAPPSWTPASGSLRVRCAARPRSAKPGPGGWNRIHLIVSDIAAEVARLEQAGLSFRNDIVTGPGGSQILLKDPSGNVIELFQPAGT